MATRRSSDPEPRAAKKFISWIWGLHGGLAASVFPCVSRTYNTIYLDITVLPNTILDTLWFSNNKEYHIWFKLTLFPFIDGSLLVVVPSARWLTAKWTVALVTFWNVYDWLFFHMLTYLLSSAGYLQSIFFLKYNFTVWLVIYALKTGHCERWVSKLAAKWLSR